MGTKFTGKIVEVIESLKNQERLVTFFENYQNNTHTQIKDLRDPNGRSLLHLASYCGNYVALDVLISVFELDPNAKDNNDETPIKLVSNKVSNCSEDILHQTIKTLIDGGADITNIGSSLLKNSIVRDDGCKTMKYLLEKEYKVSGNDRIANLEFALNYFQSSTKNCKDYRGRFKLFTNKLICLIDYEKEITKKNANSILEIAEKYNDNKLKEVLFNRILATNKDENSNQKEEAIGDTSQQMKLDPKKFISRFAKSTHTSYEEIIAKKYGNKIVEKLEEFFNQKETVANGRSHKKIINA